MIAAPPIEDIVQSIVEIAHPRRVVLFGSHARGDARPDSDVDLMVEIDAEPDPRGREAAIRSLWRHEAWSVDPKVYSTAWVERMRDDPGTLLYTIVREGKVLYTRPETDGVQRAIVRENPSAPDSLDWWIRAADVDLLDIENNLAAKRVPWDAICFHAQQAAEKYLKTLLIQRWRRPERTHDLGTVLAACRAAGYSLPGIDGDCTLLSRFAIESRYPDDFRAPPPPPTALEGRAAADACQRIVASAKRHLPRAVP